MYRSGQKIVCVYDGLYPGYIRGFSASEQIVKGEIYTVLRSIVDDDGDEILHLHEVCRDEESRTIWGDSAGYVATRFRPLIERKTDTGMAVLEQIRRDVESYVPHKIPEDVR